MTKISKTIYAKKPASTVTRGHSTYSLTGTKNDYGRYFTFFVIL